MTKGTLLVADDEAAIRESLSEVLREEGFDVIEATDGLEAIAALQGRDFDLVIADLRMPGADGLEVLRRTRELAPQTLVILVTAYASLETAVEALRQGAHDYIMKPLIFEDVLGKVRRLLDYKQLAWEAQVLRREVDAGFDFENFVGKSRVMAEIATLIRKVAPTNSTVLITGESGAGKEVVARAIHHFSEQRDKLFLPVNCGAIPENLLESQLFGHLKGSFTGATSAQEGLFQRARGGTIFLDEIGDLPLNLQVKLHRAIEEKEVLPVGGAVPIKVEVRIIAATNRVLKEEVAKGRFREDLYYRLNVLEIQVPPLRERREDVPLLVDYFVAKHNRDLKKAFKGVDNATMKTLMALSWKGNVRELDNVIEHSMILGEGEWITLKDLPRSLVDDGTAIPFSGDCLRDALRSYEKTHIETVLKRTEHDKRRAADLLGISLSSLYRKIDELEIGSLMPDPRRRSVHAVVPQNRRT
jgi:DNA-binding NtrC family response regulator